MISLAKLALWGPLLVGANAFRLLDIRDQTCSGKYSTPPFFLLTCKANAEVSGSKIDGGVCLSVDGNVCCDGGPIGGCMFSSGVCCQNGYFCYEGQFCSSTSQSADDSSGLDTNCCQDEACNTVIGLAPYVIAYSEQPFYSGKSGAPATTSAGSTPTGTGSVAGATTGGTTSQSPTATAKGSATTSAASSAASPTSSKTSGAGQVGRSNYLGGIYAMTAVLGFGSLMVLL